MGILTFKRIQHVASQANSNPLESTERRISPWFLPLLNVFIFPGLLVIPYSIGLYHGHFNAILPTVSHTGTEFPEGFAFAIILNIASISYSLDIIIRYLMLHSRMGLFTDIQAYPKWFSKLCYLSNFIALFLGLFSCIGIMIVANCEVTLDPTLHNLGSLIGFTSCSIYSGMCTVMLAYMPKRLWAALIRIPLCLGVILGSLGYGISSGYARYVPRVASTNPHAFMMNTNAGPHTPPFIYQDMSAKYGYSIYMMPTFEWLTLLFMGLFYVTLIPDYIDYSITIPKLSASYTMTPVSQQSYTMTPVYQQHTQKMTI